MRALCIYLPRWATDLRRRAAPDDVRALVTVTRQAHRQVVAACCAKAQQAGILPGMSLAHAGALLAEKDLRVEPHDPAHDAQALEHLARWANKLLPKVMPQPLQAVLLANVTGCKRLYRGEDRLLHRLAHALRQARMTAQIAIAPTYGAAWALAHHDPNPARIVTDADLKDALSLLPVVALRIDESICQVLDDMGVRTIGQLMELPRASLPSRFTADLLHRLDQAMGRAGETIEPLRPRPVIRAERTFAGPVCSLEALAVTVRQLLGDVCCQLLAAESGMRQLCVDLHRYEADDLQLHVQVGRPSRHRAHLWQLLWPKLERAHLGHGVEAVAIEAITVARLAHQQLGPQPSAVAHERELAELLDVLVARLGVRQVSRIQTHGTHEPEGVYCRRPTSVEPASNNALITPHTRPSRLLHPPEPTRVMVLTPDGPVLRLQWRGRDCAITACHGPECIGGVWWREQTAQRDYFCVQTDDGQWLWLYRQLKHADVPQHADWFVHGLWV